MRELSELRLEINEIDRELTKLLERRMSIAYEVGKYKKANNIKIFDRVREEEVLNKNADLVQSEELKPYVKKIFRGIMNVSKEYQSVVLGENNE